jgi:hypothetical protein
VDRNSALLPALGLKGLRRLEKLAHLARCDSALSKHLRTARQRVLLAYCGEGANPSPALGL